MDDSEGLSEEQLAELISSLRQLIKRDIPHTLMIEQRVEGKIDHLVSMTNSIRQVTETHGRIIYGDGEEHRGLIGRQNAIEDKFKLVWMAIGVFGTAVIIGVANLVLGYFKK